MGYMKHDAIIVTAFCDEDIGRAVARADQLELTHTPVVTGPVNHHPTFLIVPDGSAVDPRCYDLAETLLAYDKHDDDDAWALASRIQRAFEDWFEDWDEARRPEGLP